MRKTFENFVWVIVVIVACLLLSDLWLTILFIFVHEIGHYTAGKLLGYNITAAAILPIGLRFGFREEFINPWKDIIISLSGPLMNFLLFILFLFLNKDFKNLSLLRDINLVLCIFNMLPIAFLDGGRILRAFISFNGGYYYGYMTTNLTGIIFGFLIIILSILSGVSIRKLPLMGMGIFFIYKSIRNIKGITFNIINEIISRSNYNKDIKTLPIIMRAYDGNIKILDIIKKFCFNKYYFIYIIDNGYLRYNINETDLIKLYCNYGNISLKDCADYLS